MVTSMGQGCMTLSELPAHLQASESVVLRCLKEVGLSTKNRFSPLEVRKVLFCLMDFPADLINAYTEVNGEVVLKNA